MAFDKKAYSKQYGARYYKEHPEYFVEARKKRHRIASTLVSEARSQPCTDCGQSYPPCVMEFDHVRGTKAFNIGGAYGLGAEMLKKEITKCDVVCANCHCVRTFNSGVLRRGGRKTVGKVIAEGIVEALK
jgi:hypothetical protein